MHFDFQRQLNFGNSLNQNHLNPSACPLHTKQHASWTKFSLGRNDVCKCSHEAALAGPLSGTERKTLDFFFYRSEEFIP